PAEGARLDPPPALDDGRIAAALPPAGAGPAGARGPARAGPGVPARVVARAAGGGEVDGPRAPRREGGGEAEVAGVDHRPLPRGAETLGARGVGGGGAGARSGLRPRAPAPGALGVRDLRRAGPGSSPLGDDLPAPPGRAERGAGARPPDRRRGGRRARGRPGGGGEALRPGLRPEEALRQGRGLAGPVHVVGEAAAGGRV